MKKHLKAKHEIKAKVKAALDEAKNKRIEKAGHEMDHQEKIQILKSMFEQEELWLIGQKVL